MYRPVLDPAGGSLALSALFAMLPLLTLFILLGVLRLSAWKAALLSLLVALLVAVLVYPMPVGQALLAGTEGAAFGFFPIMWIVITAIWVYNMTVVTGHFDVLRRTIAGRESRSVLVRRARPSPPLELHVPTPRRVREPQRAGENHERDEQPEARVQRHGNGGFGHRCSSPDGTAYQRQVLYPPGQRTPSQLASRSRPNTQ